MKFTAIERKTGEVLFKGDADSLIELESEDTLILPELSPDNTYFDVNNLVWVGIPSRPSSVHLWDVVSKVWVDPRTPETEWPIVRTERNRLLQASDWTQLPDVPLTTKEAWAAYRQALRDVTLQPDPFNIVWPTPPA